MYRGCHPAPDVPIRTSYLIITCTLLITYLLQILPRNFYCRLTYRYNHRLPLIVFRLSGLISFALHLYASTKVLLERSPETHHLKEIWLRFLGQNEEPNTFARIRLALGNVVWALQEDLTITTYGTDVLFSLISILAWTAIGSVSVHGLLESTFLNVPPSVEIPHLDMDHLVNAVSSQIAEHTPWGGESDAQEFRKRGAVRRTARSKSRGRGAATPTRRSSRKASTAMEEDAEYKPTTDLKRQVEAAAVSEGVGGGLENAAESDEAVALSMALFFVGGLGTVSAASFGGTTHAKV